MRHHGQAADGEWRAEVMERIDALRHTPAAGPAKLAIRPALGWLCVGVGLVGIFFPIVQGIPLVLAGMAILGPESWPARQARKALRAWREWLSERRLERMNRKM